jgi:hypothetical protein
VNIVKEKDASGVYHSIFYLVDGTVITCVLLVSLRKISSLLSEFPEIKQSHTMMRNHLIFFIFEETCVLADTFFKILVHFDAVAMEPNNIGMVGVILNCWCAVAGVMVDCYIAYLMVNLCSPKDKQK